MTVHEYEGDAQVPDVICPKCKGDCGGFQGVRHSGGRVRAIYKCADCGHGWPRRKIPEGVTVPDEAPARGDRPTQSGPTPEALALQARRAKESARAARYRQGRIGRYVETVLSMGTINDDGYPPRTAATGRDRLAFFTQHPISEIVSGPRY